jgi:hypothetical protein
MKLKSLLLNSLIILFVLLINANSYSQNKTNKQENTNSQQAANNQQTQQSQNANPSIQPVFVVGDIRFLYLSLNTIEIKGNEVDVFLDLQEKIKQVLETQSVAILKDEQNLQIDLDVQTAQRLITYSTRITLKAENAFRLKRFQKAIADAAKK